MRIRWFGSPWPSASRRAPICDDDHYRAETPVGKLCTFCAEPIEWDDRGIIMGASAGIEEGFECIFGARRYYVCAAHIDCHIGSVAPAAAGFIERKSAPLFAVCFNCRAISPESEWTYWQRDDEDGWRRSEPGESDAMCKCPKCRWEHVDDDSGPGMDTGTFAEMQAERALVITRYPDLAEEWPDA